MPCSTTAKSAVSCTTESRSTSFRLLPPITEIDCQILCTGSVLQELSRGGARLLSAGPASHSRRSGGSAQIWVASRNFRAVSCVKGTMLTRRLLILLSITCGLEAQQSKLVSETTATEESNVAH